MSLSSDYPVKRTVPQVVGLAYEGAVALERRLGLHIADPNPDAAPISNYWWEHQELVVLTQHPAAGTQIDRQTSVTITLGQPDAPVGARARTDDPPALSAEAQEAPGGLGRIVED